MTPRTIHLISAIIGIALIVTLAFFLPDKVATHFNTSGQPNAWSSNTANTLVVSGIFVFVNIIFLGIPMLLRKLPVSLINLPNGDYWLAPERKESTLLKFSSIFAEIGIAINVLFIAVSFLSFRANMSQQALPSTIMLAAVGTFFVFLIAWIIRLILAFRKPSV